MNEKQKELADCIVEAFGKSLEALDLALEQMIKLSSELPKEEQKRVNDAMNLILDHIKASIRETEYYLQPIPNHSKEYTF